MHESAVAGEPSFFLHLYRHLLRPPSELVVLALSQAPITPNPILRGVWKDTILPKYWVTPSNERFDYFSHFHEHKS